MPTAGRARLGLALPAGYEGVAKENAAQGVQGGMQAAFDLALALKNAENIDVEPYQPIPVG